MNIELKKGNVIKSVDSEDKAKSLEAKGFLRMDGKLGLFETGNMDVNELRKELMATKLQLEVAKKVNEIYKKDLSSGKEQLQEAEKKIQALEMELVSVKEQLESSIKKKAKVTEK